jgi:alpha-aminoadipate carrier protein LysW
MGRARALAQQERDEGEEPMTEQAQNATCPECGAQWELSGVEQGEIVTCPDCGVDLEVLSTAPITVGLAPEEGEDWGE